MNAWLALKIWEKYCRREILEVIPDIGSHDDNIDLALHLEIFGLVTYPQPLLKSVL